jgi:hypothetical protein
MGPECYRVLAEELAWEVVSSHDAFGLLALMRGQLAERLGHDEAARLCGALAGLDRDDLLVEAQAVLSEGYMDAVADSEEDESLDALTLELEGLGTSSLRRLSHSAQSMYAVCDWDEGPVQGFSAQDMLSAECWRSVPLPEPCLN